MMPGGFFLWFLVLFYCLEGIILKIVMMKDGNTYLSITILSTVISKDGNTLRIVMPYVRFTYSWRV